ncbi:MAG: phosphopentomutase [Desulfuromonas sp.]|nr:MAG: phosphopentomutase [Desulfuromonas sp.]
MFKRIIIIVLDGVGVGALPDAATYGDRDAATLQHVAMTVGGLRLPNLERLGLGRIAPIQGVRVLADPRGCWGKMAERSPGKDSVTGHWELAGIVLDQPFATYPEGFPEEIISAFIVATGLRPLGNVAASGTDILRQLGEEHLKTGRPIVYTSSDSVFQIAAHEEIIPREELYAICRKTEKILQPYNVCRVIARPFSGAGAADFFRTNGRHDFSLKPPRPNLLQLLSEHGVETFGVGKIHDLYAGAGLNDFLLSSGNRDGMAKMLTVLSHVESGLIMTNLVDFDMLYGHRLDARGFAGALEEFDAWLPRLIETLRQDDLLIVTADHGCDPTTPGTDHTREYIPLLVTTKKGLDGVDLGTRKSFADVGASVAENFRLHLEHGQSFLSSLLLN